ncbi:MAG: hypothetical protein M3T56_08550 [Chloroflexota bacterium]|nr:hypothetical protein [Chloroflexota bacterium]
MADEWERKRSLEDRGAGIITNVGVITGIAFGAASLFLQSNEPAPLTAQLAAIEGFVFLIGSGVFGILLTWPRAYEAFSSDELTRLTEARFWTGRQSIAALRTTETRIRMLRTARDANTDKAWTLQVALAMEVLGILALAIAIAAVLVSRTAPR